MTTTTAPDTAEVALLELHQIVPHPHNVRTKLGDLTGLTDSIEEKGVLLPILVLPPATDGGPYTLIDGHRRLEAARLTDAQAPIQAIVRAMSEQDVIEAMLVAGLHQADITPVDEARGYARLIDLGTTISSIAAKVGRTEKHVKGRIALLELPVDVLVLVDDGRVTLGDAAELLSHADDTEAMAWLADNIPATREEMEDDDSFYDGPVHALTIHVRDRDRELSRLAAIAAVTDAGLRLFDPPRAFWPSFGLGNLTNPVKVEHLADLDGTAHETEPCHAVWVKPAGGDFEAVPMCDAPKRHTTLAPEDQQSLLQLDPDLYRHLDPANRQTGAAGIGAQPGDPLAREREAARAAASAARLEWLKAKFQSAAFPSIPTVAAKIIAADAYDAAFDLLGVDDEDQFATCEPHLQAWAALIGPLERQVQNGWSMEDSWFDLLDYYIELGYEISDYERTVLDDHHRRLEAYRLVEIDDHTTLESPPGPTEKDKALDEFRALASVDTPEMAASRSQILARLERQATNLEDGPVLDLVNAKIAILNELMPKAVDAGDTLDAEVAADLAPEEVPA